MKRFQFKTLRGRLTAHLITPVVFTLAAAGMAGFIYARGTLLDQWDRTVAVQLGSAAQEVESQLSRPLELMQIFATMGAGAPDAGLLEAIVQRLDGLSDVIRTDLTWYAAASESPAQAHPAKGRRGAFRRFQRGAFTQIGPPRMDESVGMQTVTISMALLDAEDTPVGELLIVIKFDNLVSEITNSDWWQTAIACFADRTSGDIILASRQMQGRQRLGETGDALENELLARIAGAPMGTLLGPGIPPRRVAGFHRLETFPWALVIFAEGKTILAPIINFRNGFIIGALGLLLIIFGIVRINVNRVTDTIRHLTRRAVSIASGEYDEKIPVRSPDEIGQLAVSFNAMIDGLKERDTIRNTFGQYVDPDFARDLLRRPETGRLGGRNQEVVVIMADIRGFTPMAERLSPEATIDVLNRYFSAIIPLLRKNGGIVVDFIGDAILAFFEPMHEPLPETVNRCVACAFEMQRATDELNPSLVRQGLGELKIGIGIHSGPVVVGVIGSKTRKKYGIVGACVNECQRIQQQSRAGETLVSEPVFHRLGDRVVTVRSLTADLKGVSRPLPLRAVAPRDESDTHSPKETT